MSTAAGGGICGLVWQWTVGDGTAADGTAAPDPAVAATLAAGVAASLPVSAGLRSAVSRRQVEQAAVGADAFAGDSFDGVALAPPISLLTTFVVASWTFCPASLMAVSAASADCRTGDSGDDPPTM